MEILEKKIKLDDADLLTLLGYNDTFLRLIENRFRTAIIVRGNNLILKGDSDEIKLIETIFKELTYLINRNGTLNEHDVTTVIDLVTASQSPEPVPVSDPNSIIYQGPKDVIRARSKKQADYFQAVNNNDLVFSIGPAGTGKTFLAVAMALASLKRNEVSKIILSRPAVEAGESLGFLPGDLQEKLDPYLKPLTDALFNMLTAEKMKSLMDKDIVEITPLAYMRGRTLNDSFIILDEAQNATITQMKMFLTRMGTNSKAIVTGDITQIDLHKKRDSGLVDVQNILKGIDGIEFVYFSERDVIRHKLVAEIIKAYEKVSEKDTEKDDDTGNRNT